MDNKKQQNNIMTTINKKDLRVLKEVYTSLDNFIERELDYIPPNLIGNRNKLNILLKEHSVKFNKAHKII